MVSARYQVVQPKQVLEFYRDLTEVSGYELETAGVLKAGRKFWALARTGKSSALKGNDVVNGYLLLATSCDGTLATTATPRLWPGPWFEGFFFFTSSLWTRCLYAATRPPRKIDARRRVCVRLRAMQTQKSLADRFTQGQHGTSRGGDMSFETMLINGLQKGLGRWAKSPHAFTVARNGGAESAIRAQLLYDLEIETDCFAFTESDRSRIDVTLRPKCAPMKSVCLLELKHNFLHSEQIRYIKGSLEGAPKQLTRAEVAEGKVFARYYLHLIVELFRMPQVGPNDHLLAATHNHLVPRYKQFKIPEDATEYTSGSLGQLEGILGEHYARYPIKPEAKDRSGHATLYCWLYAVSKAGKHKPVKDFATVLSK